MGSPSVLVDHPFPEVLDLVARERIGDEPSVPGWSSWRRELVGAVLDPPLVERYRAGRRTHGDRAPGIDRDEFVAAVLVDGGSWLRDHLPVAERLCRTVTVLTTAAASRLHRHFAEDRAALREDLGVGAEETIVQVHPGQGDSHDGGRTVVVVRLSSGRRLVYKPRSLGPETTLDEVCRQVEKLCGGTGARAFCVVDRPDHGWMTHLEPDDAPVDAALFYRRSGVLLAVTTAIGMSDLHGENIMAVADRPVVIDAETILPAQIVGIEPSAWQPGSDYAGRTVLGPGLLPRTVPVFRQRTQLGADTVFRLGGLDEIPVVTRAVRRWRWAGDEVEQVVVDEDGPAPRNLPHPPTEGPQNRGELTAAGFSAAWAVLRSDGERLLSPLLELTTRVLPRNTSLYASALKAAGTPTAMSSEAAHRRALELRLGADPAGVQLREAELPWLLQRDVPRFTADPDSVQLCVAGRPSPVRLARPPAQQARERMTALISAPPSWLDEQVELIRASFSPVHGLAIDEREDHSSPLTKSTGSRSSGRSADPLTAVERLAAVLLDRRRVDRLGTSWLVVHRDQASGTLMPSAAGAGLRAGTAGIAVFLATAGVRLGRPDLLAAADCAVQDVIAAALRVADNTLPRSGSPVDLGLDIGLGGAVWTLARCGAVLDRPDLLDAAARVAAVARTQRLSPGHRVDADGGIAGLLMALTELAGAAGSRADADHWGALLLAELSYRPGGRRGFATVAEAWSVVTALCGWVAAGGDPRARDTAERLTTMLLPREGAAVADVAGLLARQRASAALRAVDARVEVPVDLTAAKPVDDSLARGTAGLLLDFEKSLFWFHKTTKD